MRRPSSLSSARCAAERARRSVAPSALACSSRIRSPARTARVAARLSPALRASTDRAYHRRARKAAGPPPGVPAPAG
ncbi:hypothetical protein, partial [Amycolatopsis solani]|uniref:hypothetical protein n=1 Tax=Amycolatopsis solani TaxID=3028615 RepID=UPI0025B11890